MERKGSSVGAARILRGILRRVNNKAVLPDDEVVGVAIGIADASCQPPGECRRENSAVGVDDRERLGVGIFILLEAVDL